MNIIIAGTRDFSDYEKLKERCDAFIEDLDTNEPITIISGGAPGADRLGERYAIEKGYQVRIFYANWDLHGNSAGPIRNNEMAEIADVVIVFWDGKSRGTKNMIDIANKKNLKLYICNYG